MEFSSNKLSILVNSCDSYEDLWYPFFELFRMNWSDCRYPIYLNTETKSYTHPKEMPQEIISLNYKTNRSWSERLYSALNRIPSDYVLFLMDDYFLVDKVKSDEIIEVLGFLETNKNVANIILYPLGANGSISEKNPRLIKLNKMPPNLVCCCTTSIWRKEVLLKLIRKSESPWEFEENGTQRAYKSQWDFYALEPSKANDIGLIYPFRLAPIHGIGVLQGKWNFNNRDLFDRFGIQTDFSNRDSWGSYEEIQEYYKTKLNRRISIPKSRMMLHKVLPNFIIALVRKLKSR